MSEAVPALMSLPVPDEELALFLLTVAACLRQESGSPAKVYRLRGGDPGFVKRLVLAHDDRPGLDAAVRAWLDRAEPEPLPPPVVPEHSPV